MTGHGKVNALKEKNSWGFKNTKEDIERVSKQIREDLGLGECDCMKNTIEITEEERRTLLDWWNVIMSTIDHPVHISHLNLAKKLGYDPPALSNQSLASEHFNCEKCNMPLDVVDGPYFCGDENCFICKEVSTCSASCHEELRSIKEEK